MTKNDTVSKTPTSGIGFIGVGEMGAPMVTNLLRAGYTVHVFDLDSARMQPLVEIGARACDDVEECLQSGQWICTSLPSSAAFVQVATRVLLSRIHAGQIFLDFGTTIPHETRRIARELKRHGAHLLDVPVSGGAHGAQQARLKVFAGGDQSTLERVRPLLEAVAGPDEIHYCGPSGCGQIVKGVNQLLMGLMAAACLEAMSFGVRGGVAVEALATALDGPEAWRQHFARVAHQVQDSGGENVGVKFRELSYFLREAEVQNIELPLSKVLWEFCEAGERVVIDDHRPAPSFWHELTREREQTS